MSAQPRDQFQNGNFCKLHKSDRNSTKPATASSAVRAILSATPAKSTRNLSAPTPSPKLTARSPTDATAKRKIGSKNTTKAPQASGDARAVTTATRFVRWKLRRWIKLVRLNRRFSIAKTTKPVDRSATAKF